MSIEVEQMPIFRILVKGSNLSLDIDGRRRKYGFYQTYWLEGNEVDEVKRAALEAVSLNTELRETLLSDSRDPPRFEVEEFELVEGCIDVEANPTGLAIFPEQTKWWIWPR